MNIHYSELCINIQTDTYLRAVVPEIIIHFPSYLWNISRLFILDPNYLTVHTLHDISCDRCESTRTVNTILTGQNICHK